MSLRDISAEAGCGLRTIARWMKQHGIPTRDAIQMLRESGPKRRGAQSGTWKGGRPRCACGRQINYTRTQCQPCYTGGLNGSRNPNWRGVADVLKLVRQWSEGHWRPLVWKRDQDRCQSCGESEGEALHAHHKVSLALIMQRRQAALSPDLSTPEARVEFARLLIDDPEVRSIDNGITLCEPCHVALHRVLPQSPRRPRRKRA